LAPIIYLKEIDVKYVHSHHTAGREARIIFEVDVIGDGKDLEGFVNFVEGKMITILKSYSMDWHVKPENERIEFILGIMGQIMELQSAGKLREAKALLKLVEVVLPEYRDSKQYQVAEDLRNTIYDNLYLGKKK